MIFSFVLKNARYAKYSNNLNSLYISSKNFKIVFCLLTYQTNEETIMIFFNVINKVYLKLNQCI